jgi:hypothetical protein
MKKLSTLLFAILFTNTIIVAQDTLYICKSGVVVHKQALAEIDSITFYNPNKAEVVDKSATGTNNSLQAENTFNTVVNSVVINCESTVAKSTCPSVSFLPSDLLTYPKTLTIDYGTSGCTLGAYPISGKIIATLSGKIREVGTTISITFENYTIDTITVSGTISLTVEEYSAINKTITIASSTTNGVLTTPSGTINYNSSKTIKYYFNTIGNYTDNEFEVYAGTTTSVVALDGKTYSTEVLENIYIKPCSSIYQIVDGVYKITSSELTFPVEINFGDGECDNVATVSTVISITYGNHTYEQDYSYNIVLP